MIGLFSFLFVASLVALAVAAVLLVVRAVKKKPKKPVAVVAGASLLVCILSLVVVGTTYQPTPEQIAERERVAAEREAAKAERERQKAEEAARKEAEAAAQREAEAAQSESKAPTAEPPASSEVPEQSEPVSPATPEESEPPAESENPAHSDAPSTTPSAPAEPKKFEVSLEVSVDENSGKPVFTIDTNLPNETNLMLTLSRGDYTGQTHVIVKNGVASSEEFSDKGSPLTSGEYLLTVSMSIPKLQSDAVRKVIGENGENMTGKYVLDSEIGDSVYVSGDFNFSLSGAAESDVPSEPDTKLVRELFDALLENPDFEGGVISVNPRTIDGEIYSWSIIDVVVPDAWYYLEEFQKERYCSNVGDYIKSALITGGVAENEAGCSVHFFDVAGEEVASSKMFGGYKIKE